jgi:CRP-like cAMP-binding protein
MTKSFSVNLILKHMEQTKSALQTTLSKMFSFLNDEDIDVFLSICEYRKLKNKEKLFQKGSTARKAIFILSGFIRGYVLDNEGTEKNLTLRGEGKFASTPEWLFTDAPTKYTLEALLDSEVLVINFSDFENLAKNNPAIFDLYVFALKENLAIIGYRLESMILLSPEERYKDLLDKYPQLFQKAFNKHIANFLGITPVSFSRMLKRIKDKQ